jgi:hypothetical protein
MKPTKIPTAGIAKLIALVLAGSALVFAASAHAIPLFQQTNLVTDDQTNLVAGTLTRPGYTPAAHVDTDLVNPWGMSHTPSSPTWVSDNGTGLSTLYNGSGVKQGLVVTIPPAGSAPTGQVFNGSATDFQVNGTSANFIFATENGT